MAENVNTSSKIRLVVNIKLGKHIKNILKFLIEDRKHQIEIRKLLHESYDQESYYEYRETQIINGIEELNQNGKITRSVRCSYSRALRTLIKQGLIYSHKYKYKYEYKGKPLYTYWDSDKQDLVQKRTNPAPDKIWDSKPYFGITDAGIEYVNNLGKITLVVNVKEGALDSVGVDLPEIIGNVGTDNADNGVVGDLPKKCSNAATLITGVVGGGG